MDGGSPLNLAKNSYSAGRTLDTRPGEISDTVDNKITTRWYGRLVSAVKLKLSEKYQKKRSALVGEIYDSYCKKENMHVLSSKAGPNRFSDSYYQNIYRYKIALALDSTKLGKIIPPKSKFEEFRLDIGSSVDKIGAAVDKVETVMSKSVISILYDMIADRRSIPPRFIKCALIPHFSEKLIEKFGYDPEDAIRLTQDKLMTIGIYKEKDITFERVLDLKHQLNLYPTYKKNKEINSEPVKYHLDTPWSNAPKLPPVDGQPYQIDEEDKQYIQTEVDRGNGIKISRHDVLNRLKRLALRNKRTAVKMTVGTAFSTIAAVSVFGPAGALGAVIKSVGAVASTLGLKFLFNKYRVFNNMKLMQKYSDYANCLDKKTGKRHYSRKRHKKFLDAAKLVCSKKTAADMYAYFAELEKDVLRLERFSQKNKNMGSRNWAIKKAEHAARYKYHKDSLHAAMKEFSKFHMGGVNSLKFSEDQWSSYKSELRENVFSDLSTEKRAELIEKVVQNRDFDVGRYFIPKSNMPDWEQVLFNTEPKDTEILVEQNDLEEKTADYKNVEKEKQQSHLNDFDNLSDVKYYQDSEKNNLNVTLNDNDDNSNNNRVIKGFNDSDSNLDDNMSINGKKNERYAGDVGASTVKSQGQKGFKVEVSAIEDDEVKKFITEYGNKKEHIERKSIVKQATKWGKALISEGIFKSGRLAHKPIFFGKGQIDLSTCPTGWTDTAITKELSNILPTVSVEGAGFLFAFTVGDILIEATNDVQRNARIKRLREKKDTYSGIGFFKRKRTNREEVNTLREAAKVKMSDYVSTIKFVQKGHEKINIKIEELRKLSTLRGEGKPFQNLSEDEKCKCLGLMMDRELYKEMLNHKVMGSMWGFYERVMRNSKDFEERVAGLITD